MPPNLTAGANQTIDQVKIFGGYTRFFTDILPPTPDVPARSILTTTSLAVRHATGHNPGPVHLNLQFREPLAPVQSALDERWLPALLEGTERWVASTRPFTVPVLASGSTQGGAAGAPPGRSRQLDEVVRDILGARRGLIVASGVSDPEETMAVARLSAILGWPIAADATSGLRVVGRSGAVGPLVLQHTDHVLLGGKAVWRALRPDVVLDVGCHLVSKRLAQFLEWCTVGGGGGEGESARWIRVFPHPARHDPSHAASHAVEMRCSALLAAVETASGGASVPVDQRRYAETLTQLDDVAAAAIARGIREVEEGPEQGGEPTEVSA